MVRCGVARKSGMAQRRRDRDPLCQGSFRLSFDRVGHLEIGELAVVVAAAAPHRAEAFEAARFAIDSLKQTVPIWKKEFAEGGEYWVDDRP